MNDEYEMRISDARWWSYDIPGNIGWIIWIVTGAALCAVFAGLCYKGYKKK